MEADAESTASLRSVMGLNGLELAILLLWVVGIGAIVHTGLRAGFSVRTWAALVVAVLVPVAGSLFAIAYATLAAADRKADQQAAVFQVDPGPNPYPLSAIRPARGGVTVRIAFAA